MSPPCGFCRKLFQTSDEQVSKCKIMHLKTSIEAQYYMEVDKCKIPVEEVESEQNAGFNQKEFKFVSQDVSLICTKH